MHGIKFRRQHPIGTFVADFFCDTARLVIEIDGAVHLEPTQLARDEVREEILRAYDLTILRFNNEAVLLQLDSVLERIERAVLTQVSLRTGTAPPD